MNKEVIKDWLKAHLTEEKYEHVLGTEETAIKLAKIFKCDVEKASLAGLLHDCAKGFPYKEMVKILENNEIPLAEEEKNNRKTIHAPVGAFIAQKEFGINDEEILNAIKYHTLGRVDMTLLEKIVFLSDKIEPFTRDKNFVEKVNKVIENEKNLNEALILCYCETIKSLVERKLVINKKTISVWNNLISKSLNKNLE